MNIEQFENLLAEYWDIAYEEGKTGKPNGVNANRVLRELKAAIAAQAQQESQWISVEERLPEESVEVAACGINKWLNKNELFCLGTTKLFCGNWLNVGHVTVTHWIPLPPAPEGGE